MITIVKGSSKLIVTKGTFEEQYKQLGYQIASDKKEATKEVASIIKEDEKQDSQENKELKDLQREQKEEDKKINEKYGLETKKGKK